MSPSNGPNPLAARCRTARENAGLSQGQAAKKLGIARSSLTQAEAGNRKISADELVAMAGLYGVSLAWLADTDEAPEPETDRIELAARELARLKPEDLQSVLQLVRSIRSRGRGRS
jgi:transcriptional regulator with XRE-family HTH domain